MLLCSLTLISSSLNDGGMSEEGGRDECEEETNNLNEEGGRDE